MMLAEPSAAPEAMQSDIVAFARKVQQVTAPVTAKGVEDTALYRFTRLSSLNEVGGDPDNFGTTPAQFHTDAAYRQKHWPHEMLATSTHDTKRSEDVRARISVLSEMPSVWIKLIRRWSRINRNWRRRVDDMDAPGTHAEYLLYQTLIGTWPSTPLNGDAPEAYCKRICEYMIKASREAKRRTSWSNPNEEYESALRDFIGSILERRESNPFPARVDEFVQRILQFGRFNSLSQLLCKLTAPGVPDIYQGCELWDDSLVDPDNRRPVNYEHRRTLLASIISEERSSETGSPLAALPESWEDGLAKLYVTHRVLIFRRAHADIFRDGDYRPLKVNGAKSDHLCAYARVHPSGTIVVLVPRLFARLLGDKPGLPMGEEVWGDTTVELPEELRGAAFVSILGTSVHLPEDVNGVICVGRALGDFPIGLLSSSGTVPS
jgi:(1->4)-alpha-D-glucan 1-alpha-D-glucosylmutase